MIAIDTKIPGNTDTSASVKNKHHHNQSPHHPHPAHCDTNSLNVAVTVDLHDDDRPEDIQYCDAWLRKADIPATFFIPTSLLLDANFKYYIANLTGWKHELATHGHFHDYKEIQALKNGSLKDLEFLNTSKKCFEDFLGVPPRSFRSPAWTGLNNNTLRTLNRLGYHVDSSATPQRLGIFSSFPRENPWLFTRRSPYFILGSLIEIPTNTIIFPLASPTFQTFRVFGSRIFLSMFLMEARLIPKVVITLQLHAGDFVPHGADYKRNALRFRDFFPRTPGGICAKYWVRTMDRAKVFKTISVVLERLRKARFNTLSTLYQDILPRFKQGT